ncbi:MAG TPA: EAL domain-containing response regulator [Stellaceae bacterium]|nr:EAL domain-containing response regulator [Stellaceae bacterium]
MNWQGADDPRLLIIDDDAAFCRLVKRVAEAEGFRVVATADCDMFIRTAREWQPTLIVTDLNMPGTDGVELLRDLAGDGCGAAIVIASGIDGRTLDATLRLGAERGLHMAGTLHKPVPLGELQTLVARHRPLDDAALATDLAAVLGAGTGADVGVAGRAAGQLFLEYQPKVSCRLGRMVGVEALARWSHPRLGSIGPDRFVAVAEQRDLIDALTDWVFATAAAQAAAWHRQGLALEVAVNVSAKNLRDIRFPDKLAAKCREGGVDPALLTLEVTETSAMSDAVHMLDVLSRLRIKGFKLSLDDFGTGYSSLVQLRRMPFSELKIDLSFVTAMLRDRDSRLIVEITIDLARKLGLTSVAEGVESEALWHALQDLGCDTVQGFHLGRPMAADRIGAAAAVHHPAADGAAAVP